MSMESYGYSELLLDMNKAKEVAPRQYDEMELALKKADLYPQQIEQGDYTSLEEKYINNFIQKILFTLEVDIYPRYISSEAEGADGLEGSIIWCITPEYRPEVNNALYKQISWSEFG